MTSKGHLSLPNHQGMTGEEIATHQQNHSTAKQQFSFPKAQRFQCKTELSDYTFYALPSTKTKIGALIGSQKRTLFDQRSSDSPAPGRYEYTIEGDFKSITKRKTKGYYMALGRSDIKINNFLGGNKEGPNPLKYSNPEMLSALQKHEFSFTRSKKFQTLRKFDMDSVGPGSYKIDTSLEEQKQVLSKQLRSLCPKIQEVKVESRKKRISTEPPLYCPMMTAKGQPLKFDSSKGVKIGQSKRCTLQKAEGNPGPGQYAVFSEFLSKGKV